MSKRDKKGPKGVVFGVPPDDGVLHHGLLTYEFRPIFVGTDYFCFIHLPCHSIADIERVLIDNNGRIIFNLKCRECGKRDALKTHPYFHRLSERPKEFPYREIFFLSPRLAECVGEHWWDDV
ncbi:MAG TPA: hypothetical protein ENG21_03915 [Nitrososphaeria archaeon]|nr:hypothetical protein [Nitrososphaeria archaeon]